MYAIRLAFVLIASLFFISVACAADLSWECQGKTRFIHRGAESTYPTEEKRSYHVRDQALDTTQCSATETGLYCYGLTEQQATRRVRLHAATLTVSDTLELPTSELIFEGRCK